MRARDELSSGMRKFAARPCIQNFQSAWWIGTEPEYEEGVRCLMMNQSATASTSVQILATGWSVSSGFICRQGQ